MFRLFGAEWGVHIWLWLTIDFQRRRHVFSSFFGPHCLCSRSRARTRTGDRLAQRNPWVPYSRTFHQAIITLSFIVLSIGKHCFELSRPFRDQGKHELWIGDAIICTKKVSSKRLMGAGNACVSFFFLLLGETSHCQPDKPPLMMSYLCDWTVILPWLKAKATSLFQKDASWLSILPWVFPQGGDLLGFCGAYPSPGS